MILRKTGASFSEEGMRTPDQGAPNAVLDPVTAQRYFLIDALARNLTRNVRHIIERIDHQRFQRATTVAATSTTATTTQTNLDSQSGTKQQASLMDRWTIFLNRERQRHQYRRRGNNKNKLRKMTIDQMWSEALHHSNDSLEQ